MNETAIREGLKELREILLQTPRAGKPASLLKEGLYIHCGPVAKTGPVDVLEHLRVMVKYVVFDLEATRRENRYLRQMLETRSKREGEDGKEGGLH